MELTGSQTRQLYEHGFIRLPGIVPQHSIDVARRAINASIGERGIDPQQLRAFRSRTYCPELTADSVITDLYNRSPLKDIAQSTIGEGMLQPVAGGQIALRFPTLGDRYDPAPHIDGMYTPDNGVPKGTIANFTALVGVFLSEIPHRDMGNFSVWPGSHRVLEEYFRERGPQSLLDGFPPVDIGTPEQITGGPGDAILCHYQLAHGIAANTSPYIRYAIFFRLIHVAHDSVHWECMSDIWREWDGMQEFRTEKP